MKTKRNYERPHMRVVELRQRCQILAGSNNAKVQNYDVEETREW